MIKYNNQDLIARYYNSKPILYVYQGTVLVWKANRSCFSSGYWIDLSPWSDTEGWKDI